MDIQRESYIFSAILHIAMLLVVFFGLPEFKSDLPPEQKVMVVDIVRIEEPVRAPEPKATVKKVKPPEQRKSVMQAQQPPKPAPKPREIERQVTRAEPKEWKPERQELIERKLAATPSEMPMVKPEPVERLSEDPVKPIERRVETVQPELELSKRLERERTSELKQREAYEAQLREQDVKKRELEQAAAPERLEKPLTPRQREIELAKLERESRKERDVKVVRLDPSIDKKITNPDGWKPIERKDLADTYSRAAQTIALPDDVREKTERLADAPPEHTLSVLERIKQSLKLARGRDLDEPKQARLQEREKRDVSVADDGVRRRELIDAALPAVEAPAAEVARTEQPLLVRRMESKRERDVEVRETETQLERRRDSEDLEKWDHSRRSAEERRMAAAQAALPDNVREQVGALAEARPDVIRAEAAAVEQKQTLRARQAGAAALARDAQSREKIEMAAQAAPVDVARRDPSRADYVPEPAERSASLKVRDAGRIERTVSRASAPAAVIEVEEIEYLAEPSRKTDGPSGWRQERRDQIETRRVTAARADLPEAQALREEVGTLSQGVAPVQAEIGAVAQTASAALSAAGGEIPLQARERQMTSGPSVARDLDAPVEVARRQAAAPQQLAMSEKSLDGLAPAIISDASGPRILRTPAAPRALEAVEARPRLDVPDETPEEWKIRERARREALKEKYEIERKDFVMSRELELAKAGEPAPPPSDLTRSEPVYFERKIQNIETEIDFMTLSERPMAPSPHGAGGVSAEYTAGSGEGRKLIRQAEPDIPKWFKERGIDAVGTFVLVISEEGEVTAVDVEKTTGSKEMDQVSVAALLKFRYEATGQVDQKRLRYRIKLQR